MAKWRTKFSSKVFNKKNESHKKQNDYFHNIVPPITNDFERDLSFNNFENTTKSSNEQEKLYDAQNVQVTSSFVIPLDDKLAQNPINNNILWPQENLTNEIKINPLALEEIKTNFKIPRALSFEIRIEKLKQLIMMLFSLIVITISSTLIGFYFSNWNLLYIPHPILTIPLVIFSLMIFFVNMLNFFSLRKEVNLYIEKTLKGSLMPPNFIIRSYRKIHGRVIIFNWLFIFCYIILSLAALFMYLISSQTLTFLVQKWTFTVPNLIAEVITILIVLGVIFFIHTMNFVFFKKRKNNIISYYGYEIVSPSDLEIYKKKINRICMIIMISFLMIFLFMIIIPIWVIKKKKKKLKL